MFMGEKNGRKVKIVKGENEVMMEKKRFGDIDMVVGRMEEKEKMKGF